MRVRSCWADGAGKERSAGGGGGCQRFPPLSRGDLSAGWPTGTARGGRVGGARHHLLCAGTRRPRRDSLRTARRDGGGPLLRCRPPPSARSTRGSARHAAPCFFLDSRAPAGRGRLRRGGDGSSRAVWRSQAGTARDGRRPPATARFSLCVTPPKALGKGGGGAGAVRWWGRGGRQSARRPSPGRLRRAGAPWARLVGGMFGS